MLATSRRVPSEPSREFLTFLRLQVVGAPIAKLPAHATRAIDGARSSPRMDSWAVCAAAAPLPPVGTDENAGEDVPASSGYYLYDDVYDDEPRVEVVDRRFQVEAVMGAGTLVGELGVLMGYTIHPRVELRGRHRMGSGWRASGRLRRAPAAAHIPPHARATFDDCRPRSVDGKVRGSGVRPSIRSRLPRCLRIHGTHRPLRTVRRMNAMNNLRSLPTNRVVAFARWVQLDAGYEFRKKGGFTLLLAGGLAWLTNPSECDDHGGPCSEDVIGFCFQR